MHSHILSFTIDGVEARSVNVEVSVSSGLASFHIIGLADQTTRESKDRIEQALKYTNYELPPGNITVNLSPADIKKKGSHFDLPIALGILMASGQIPATNLSQYMIAGELSLKGNVLVSRGIFNASLLANRLKIEYFLCPRQVVSEVSDDLKCLFANDLPSAIKQLSEPKIEPYKAKNIAMTMNASANQKSEGELDYSQVLGQPRAKQALEIAALGGLNLLFIGPPGCGKSMLIKRLPTILPPLSVEETLEVTQIHAVYHRGVNQLIHQRPFREIGPDISLPGLLGGGNPFLPGEVSLAHRGVLFLDEVSEFSVQNLQSLRSPMQEKQIIIRRSNYHVTLPAHFMLVAATNPCDCGHFGDELKICKCSPTSVERLYRRLSGPILDRIPLILYLQAPSHIGISSQCKISSSVMRERILSARKRIKAQSHRFNTNGMQGLLKLSWVEKSMEMSIRQGLLSRRKMLSTVWVGYLISLLEGEAFREEHLFQALSFTQTQGILPYA